jgi:hypothetical protein
LILGRTSEDFNYTNATRLRSSSQNPFSLDELVRGPKTTNTGFEADFQQPKRTMASFQLVIYDVRPTEVRDGYHLIFHDPFALPSKHSMNFQTQTNRSSEFFINPKIVYLHESLVDYGPEE